MSGIFIFNRYFGFSFCILYHRFRHLFYSRIWVGCFVPMIITKKKKKKKERKKKASSLLPHKNCVYVTLRGNV